MLRLNLYCSVVPSSRKANYENSFSTIIQHGRKQILHGRIRFAVRALKDERDGRKGGAPGQSWDPGLEVEVPFEQRPVSFIQLFLIIFVTSLWVSLGPGSFLLRLGGLWLVTFTVLGVPIAAASFNPPRKILSATPIFHLDQFEWQFISYSRDASLPRVILT